MVKNFKNKIFLVTAALILCSIFVRAEDLGDIRLRINESIANETFKAMIEARGLNFGDYTGGYGLDAWYVNVEDASFDIKPGNKVEIDISVKAYARIDCWLFQVKIIENARGILEGKIERRGNEQDGYTLVFCPIRLNAALWGDLPDFIEDLFNILVNGASLFVYKFPEVKINLGASFVPRQIEGLFTSSMPNIVTTENDIVISFTVREPQNEIIENKTVQSGEQKYFEALDEIVTQGSFIVNTDGKAILNSGRKIKLEPSFNAKHGSEFKAVIDQTLAQ
ncbi:3-coathanger stack domain-containing protein [bacterium]